MVIEKCGKSAVVLGGVGLSLLVARVPLLDGLTYEYAVVVGVVAFAAALVAGSRAGERLGDPYAVRWRLLSDTPWGRVRGNLWWWLGGLVGAVLAAAVVPVIVGEQAACAWERGVAVYLLVAPPAVPLGLAIGLTSRVLGRRSHWRRFGVVVGALLAAVGLTCLEVVAGPRAVFHNLVIGIVSNTAYLGLEETVRIGPDDLLHRLAAVVLAALLVATAMARAARVGRAATTEDAARVDQLLTGEARAARWAAAALGAVLLAMVGAGDRCGFGSGLDRVEARLSGRHETEHFVLRYRPGSEVEPALAGIADDCEWSYRRLTARLGLDGAVPPTTVYVYADAAEQASLTGASDFLFAKPWLGQLHTRLDDLGGLAAFEHELVHVLAARFGLPVARVSARYGLIEGLAEAVAADYADRPWRHEEVAAALRLDLLPPAASVIGNVGFAARDARVSYMAAASFCGFLLHRFGAERLRAVYAWGDFETVYGRDLTALDGEWRAYLGEVAVGPRALSSSSRAFDREVSPAFFKRLCARLGPRVERASDREPDVGSGKYEERLAELDRLASAGPLLSRDQALTALATQLARGGRFAEAAAVNERRAALGVAPPHVQAALEAVAAAGLEVAKPGVEAVRSEPDMAQLLILLTTGYGPEGDFGPFGELARSLAARDPIATSLVAARAIGGCGFGLEQLEARLLVRLARAARRAGRSEAARELAQTARSVAVDGTDSGVDAALELERLGRAGPSAI